MSRIETIGNATLYLADCREVLPTLPKVDAVITDPPYGTGERLRVGGEFVNTRQEWDEWDSAWIALIGGAALAFFCPPKRVSEGLIHADRIFAWVSANPIAKKGVSPRYGIQPVLARGPFPANYGLDWFKHRSNIQTSDHAHQKPVEVMTWLVEAMTEAGQTACDPFMGSGTTGVACMNLQRHFIGIEREPKYFDIACRRIDDAQRQQRMFA